MLTPADVTKIPTDDLIDIHRLIKRSQATLEYDSFLKVFVPEEVEAELKKRGQL